LRLSDLNKETTYLLTYLLQFNQKARGGVSAVRNVRLLK